MKIKYVGNGPVIADIHNFKGILKKGDVFEVHKEFYEKNMKENLNFEIVEITKKLKGVK